MLRGTRQRGSGKAGVVSSRVGRMHTSTAKKIHALPTMATIRIGFTGSEEKIDLISEVLMLGQPTLGQSRASLTATESKASHTQ